MSRLRVHSLSMSLDGYSAGPRQDRDNPIGVNGLSLFDWQFATRTFHTEHGQEGGTTGIDDDFVARGFHGVGAWIVGRNMFGPIRGAWPDDSWEGWWGDSPPFHTPVFVLTNYPRASISTSGGTTFHFVTDGIHAALERAFEAAQGQDIRLGGGVSAIRQYLRAELIDEMHCAIAPLRRSVWVPEKACFRVSTYARSAMCAPNTSPPRARRTLSLPGVSESGDEPLYTPNSARIAAAMASACRRMACSLSASIITRASASVPE